MRWMIFALSLMLTLSFVQQTSAEAYDVEGGVNWFSDYDSEGIGVWDDSGDGFFADDEFTGYESDDFGFDEGITDDNFETDDYGAYDSDYDWNSDDEWFDGWYGDSDGLF